MFSKYCGRPRSTQEAFNEDGRCGLLSAYTQDGFFRTGHRVNVEVSGLLSHTVKVNRMTSSLCRASLMLSLRRRKKNKERDCSLAARRRLRSTSPRSRTIQRLPSKLPEPLYAFIMPCQGPADASQLEDKEGTNEKIPLLQGALRFGDAFQHVSGQLGRRSYHQEAQPWRGGWAKLRRLYTCVWVTEVYKGKYK